MTPAQLLGCVDLFARHARRRLTSGLLLFVGCAS